MDEVKPSQAAREAADKLFTQAIYGGSYSQIIVSIAEKLDALEQSAFAAGKRAGLVEAAEIAREQFGYGGNGWRAATHAITGAIEERANAD